MHLYIYIYKVLIHKYMYLLLYCFLFIIFLVDSSSGDGIAMPTSVKRHADPDDHGLGRRCLIRGLRWALGGTGNGTWTGRHWHDGDGMGNSMGIPMFLAQHDPIFGLVIICYHNLLKMMNQLSYW